MSDVVIEGTDTHEPALVIGYRSSRRGRNIFHSVEESEGFAVVLRNASPRAGRIDALCDDLTEAMALEADLAEGHTLTLSSASKPALDMTFALDGEVTVELEPRARRRWIVTFQYQEIT